MSATIPPSWHDTPDDGRAHAGSISGSIRRIASSVVGQLHTRLELIQCDLAREKLRFEAFAIAGALSLFFAFLAFMLAIFVVIAAAWDTPYRIATIVALLIASVIGAVLSVSACLKARRDLARPFQLTLDELAKDKRAIEAFSRERHSNFEQTP